ncbi:hypothetical protein Q7P37_004627 [Cladosporium fusiforme]
MTSSSSQDNLTIIVGAGIVGSALAAFLSKDTSTDQILLIDKSFSEILGSTAYAPGFLGQYNESSVLTELAVDSLKDYDRFPGIFQRVGGLEFASTDDGINKLKNRCSKANEAGVSARLLAEEDISATVPGFVERKSFKDAIYFPTDGVADTKALCQMYRNIARQQGVDTLEASVDGIEMKSGALQGLRIATGEVIQAKNIIFATGIWTPSLMQDTVKTPLPAIPVSHPYVYTNGAEDRAQTPFCRWPEDHVYARDHGDRCGLGSYAHEPIHVKSLETTASTSWPATTFTPVIAHAAASKIASTSELGKLATFEDSPETPSVHMTSGIFAVTPDNLPLLGQVPGMDNLWLATGIWITHAAGCARLLARKIRGEEFDEEIAQALDPLRFADGNPRDIEAIALEQYNDIYRSKLVE